MSWKEDEIRQIVSLLLDQNPDARNEGISRLRHLNRAAINTVVRKIIEFDPPAPPADLDRLASLKRTAVAEAGPRAIAALRQFVTKDAPERYFCEAIDALHHCLESAEQGVLTLRKDTVNDPLVRALVNRGLGHPTPEVRELTAKLFTCRVVADQDSAGNAALSLLRMLVEDGGSENRFQTARGALRALGSKTIRTLRTALGHPHHVLGVSGSPEHVAEVSHLLDQIAAVIQDLGQTAAVLAQPIVDAMKAWPASRQQLAEALANIGYDEGAVVDEVTAMLPEVDRATGDCLCRYLANQKEIGRSRLFNLLKGRLALYTLDTFLKGPISTPDAFSSAVPKLVKLLAGKRCEVKIKAALLLGKLGKTAAENSTVMPRLNALCAEMVRRKKKSALKAVLVAIYAIQNDQPDAVSKIDEVVKCDQLSGRNRCVI